MSGTKAISVVKRDGTREPLSYCKLRRCIATVLHGTGYDPTPADPLAKAVLSHVASWTGERPPSTDYIFHCVRTVLLECGLIEVARELAMHRRMRGNKRKGLRLLAGDHGKAVTWRKDAVVAKIESEFGIARTTARFIAAEVELRVFALQYAELSWELVSELIRNEVCAWGLGEAVLVDAPAAEL